MISTDYRIGFPLLAALLFASGCSPAPMSRVSDMLGDSTEFSKLCESSGIELGSGGGGGGAMPGQSHHEFHYHAKAPSSSPHKAIGALRKSIHELIVHQGAVLHGQALSGSEEELTSFRYQYGWGRNEGFVFVDSVDTQPGEFDIIVVCYESTGAK